MSEDTKRLTASLHHELQLFYFSKPGFRIHTRARHLQLNSHDGWKELSGFPAWLLRLAPVDIYSTALSFNGNPIYWQDDINTSIWDLGDSLS